MNIEALKEAHDLSLDGRDFASRQIILDVIANLKKEALAKPALMIYHDHICYKSQADDQSFGFWCPVNQDLPFPDLPFPEGTKFYTTPPQPTQVKLKDDEIWKFWCLRPEVSEGENDSMEAEFVAAVRAVLAAHGIKGD